MWGIKPVFRLCGMIMLVKINQLTYESKFDRKYACSLNNHCSGLRKLKTANRRLLRRKLNRGYV